MPEQLYTLKEVGELLKVTVRTLYNWKEEGKIVFSEINGLPRVKQSELDRLLGAPLEPSNGNIPQPASTSIQ